MKFMKRKGTGETTVRAVWNDEKSKILCVVGTVEDLEKIGLLYPSDLKKTEWLAISNSDEFDNHFGKTRVEAVKHLSDAGY